MTNFVEHEAGKSKKIMESLSEDFDTIKLVKPIISEIFEYSDLDYEKPAYDTGIDYESSLENSVSTPELTWLNAVTSSFSFSEEFSETNHVDLMGHDSQGVLKNSKPLSDGSKFDKFIGNLVNDIATHSPTSQVAIDLSNPQENVGDTVGEPFTLTESIVGSDLRDDLRGTGNEDNISGGAGDDFILGRSGNDVIFGGEGNDYIEGGRGADIINGGQGRDTTSYAGAQFAISVDLINSARNKGEAAGDTHISIEAIVGSGFGDDIRANFLDDSVFGGDGNDLILARSGDDLLFGENGDDRLEGGAGSDTLYGGQGSDLLTGGAGNDTFVIESSGGADVVADFSSGEDVLLFDQVGTLAEITTSWSQVGDDVVFDLGVGNSVTVLNTTISALEDDLVIEIDSSEPLSLASISSGSFGSDLDSPFVLSFSEEIKVGNGQIELLIYGENGYEVVETLDSSAFTVSGSELSFSLEDPLDALRDYSISIGSGAVQTLDGSDFEGSIELFTAGLGVSLPSLDFSQYDRIINGATFNSTLSLDSGDSNTLIINSTFENIDGSGISLRNVENVTIANSTFKDIDDFGILLRSSGSSDSVTIVGNTFEDVGGDGIHSAKRFENGVDHRNLIIYDNELHDVATKGFFYHDIYVQSSEAVVWGNEITGTVGANGISIRGDGIVYDNYLDVSSGREYGSGIKYYSDHMTGDSKTLIIADNTINSNNLYSAIQLDQTGSNQPSSVSDEDWVVNDFFLLRNDANARNDYVIDSSLEEASWASISFIDEAPNVSQENPSPLPELSSSYFYDEPDAFIG